MSPAPTSTTPPGGGGGGGGGGGAVSWQLPEPESVKLEPAMGMNSHVYALEPSALSVSLSTPYVELLRTSLLGETDPKEVWPAPPVPTTNSRIPNAVSAVPSGVWGANRS